MRFDEDYSYLKDSSKTFYSSIKYLPLSADKKWYASLGGEARIEYADFNNEDWGRFNIGHNHFLLQRYDVHLDVHAGDKIRLFTQLRSAWESGRKNGPRPIDEDKLNFQNLFIDAKLFKQKDKSVTLRVGRQELDYGSGRLISVREGPNLRLHFDGFKIFYRSSRLYADAFVMKADTVFNGVFDNKSSNRINLWSVYGTWIIPHAGNFDFYYIGINRKSAVFEEGIAGEVRHTLGTRLWRYGGGFIYNLEWAYQFGSFSSGNISAWTASADIGYVFESIKGKPTINLRNDYISGDKKQGDGNLQTFNPIYPKGGYFGFNPQVGPVNLIDVHPYTTYTVNNHLTLSADAVFNWRYSLQDGVYRPSGNFNLAGSNSNKRYIGTAWLASALYSFNRFISFNTGIQYFQTGSFIHDEIPDYKNGLFINAKLTVKL
jgi:hypothetical protein